MKRWVVVLTIAILSLGTPSRAQTFWDTLGNLLNQGCNLTGQFNFGSNWEWLCSIKSVYSNFKWIADNFSQYMQDLTVQMLIGALEGTMQSLGWYIGPGVNQFAEDLANFAKDVRRAPQLLRQAIARAMLEDAKQKYLPLTGRYPAYSPPDLLERQKNTNPTIATGYLGQFMEQVKQIGKRAGAVEAVSNIAKEMEKKGESLTDVTRLTSQILTPKEAEQSTNGVVKAGVADTLVERAKTAASAREVMEITVEAISYLLRLQAASNPLLLDFMQAQLQAQLYSNGSIIGLYDQMAQQAEDEVGQAEFELQAYAIAANEGAREAELELGNISNMFVDIASMADNLPDGGSLQW